MILLRYKIACKMIQNFLLKKSLSPRKVIAHKKYFLCHKKPAVSKTKFIYCCCFPSMKNERIKLKAFYNKNKPSLTFVILLNFPSPTKKDFSFFFFVKTIKIFLKRKKMCKQKNK